MSKAQKELDRILQQRLGHATYLMAPLRHNIMLKILYGGTLTKEENKEAGLMSAELAEYLVWHQEP